MKSLTERQADRKKRPETNAKLFGGMAPAEESRPDENMTSTERGDPDASGAGRRTARTSRTATAKTDANTTLVPGTAAQTSGNADGQGAPADQSLNNGKGDKSSNNAAAAGNGAGDPSNPFAQPTTPPVTP